MKKAFMILSVLGLTVLFALPVYAAKGGKKGPSDRAYEKANDNASFKRDENWEPGKKGENAAEDEEEAMMQEMQSENEEQVQEEANTENKEMEQTQETQQTQKMEQRRQRKEEKQIPKIKYGKKAQRRKIIFRDSKEAFL